MYLSSSDVTSLIDRETLSLASFEYGVSLKPLNYHCKDFILHYWSTVGETYSDTRDL